MKASNEFMDAVCDGGTPVSTCGFCGVVTFSNGCDMDEDELELLLEKMRNRPATYRQDGANDSIAVGQISGINVVYGCPCDGAYKYEQFIWEHREIIMRYLRARIAKEAANANRDAESIATLGVPR